MHFDGKFVFLPLCSFVNHARATLIGTHLYNCSFPSRITTSKAKDEQNRYIMEYAL